MVTEGKDNWDLVFRRSDPQITFLCRACGGLVGALFGDGGSVPRSLLQTLLPEVHIFQTAALCQVPDTPICGR